MCLAIPDRVLTVDGEGIFMRTGKVDFAGVKRQVNLSYVPDVQVGDYVLVHVGFAISVIDEQKAARVFDDLKELGSLSETGSAA